MYEVDSDKLKVQSCTLWVVQLWKQIRVCGFQINFLFNMFDKIGSKFTIKGLLCKVK